MDRNCPTEADSHITAIRTLLNYCQQRRIRPVLSFINRIFFTQMILSIASYMMQADENRPKTSWPLRHNGPPG